MTTRQVEIHPDALAEAEAAVSWYVERSSRAPVAFLEEIDKAIESILNAPKRWPTLNRIVGECLFCDFHALLCYREKSNDLVQILAVAHGGRKPGYWKTRNR
jgi:plasmid stabilization system protein ParE